MQIVDTSSFAASDSKAKGEALILFNGYEGGQMLLKVSLLFAIFSVLNSGINSFLLRKDFRTRASSS